MLFSRRDWETCKDRGNKECSQIQANPWGEPASEYKRPQTAVKIYIPTGQWPKHTAKSTLEWPQTKKVKVLEWPSQSPDLNPIENLWKHWKIAVHRHSPSNLTELELICKEEWEKIPKSRCVKVIQTYPRRLEVVIAIKGASSKVLTQGVEYFLMQDTSAFHF